MYPPRLLIPSRQGIVKEARNNWDMFFNLPDPSARQERRRKIAKQFVYMIKLL